MATVKMLNPDKADPLERFAPTIKGGLSGKDDKKEKDSSEQDKKPGNFDPLYIVIPGALIGIAIAVYIYGNS